MTVRRSFAFCSLSHNFYAIQLELTWPHSGNSILCIACLRTTALVVLWMLDTFSLLTGAHIRLLDPRLSDMEGHNVSVCAVLSGISGEVRRPLSSTVEFESASATGKVLTCTQSSYCAY